MRKIIYRTYQKVLKLATYVMPIKEPKLIEGSHIVLEIPSILKAENISRVLLVTDATLMDLKLVEPLINALKTASIEVHIYKDVQANPTVDNVESGLALYQAHQCQGIIAFGGGSPMDCAKVVGARVARPKKSIQAMQGILKVRKKTPFLIAVPTTAGTGSEATLAAVISDPKAKLKFPINDHVLMPNIAVLDVELIMKLPPFFTATTGMDVLTHAVEAYIGRSNTKHTKKWSEDAVILVFKYLRRSYQNPQDKEARRNMLKASYYAGCAFTRAYVGYVHAIAHTLGGFYQVPHGYANAVVLPQVLKQYGKHVHRPLARLARLTDVCDEANDDALCAGKFIEAIESLNEAFSIPNHIEDIASEDIDLMVQKAYRESNPLYPVPQIWKRQDFAKIYQMLEQKNTS